MIDGCLHASKQLDKRLPVFFASFVRIAIIYLMDSFFQTASIKVFLSSFISRENNNYVIKLYNDIIFVSVVI